MKGTFRCVQWARSSMTKLRAHDGIVLIRYQSPYGPSSAGYFYRENTGVDILTFWIKYEGVLRGILKVVRAESLDQSSSLRMMPGRARVYRTE